MSKKDESNLSVCLRILTNYFQIATAAMSYNLKFPKFLVSIFYPIERAGSSTGLILSFDWLISDFNSKKISISFFKVLLTALLPIILIALFGAIWVILGRTLSRFKNIKRSIIVTSITILFVMHPTLMDATFNIFRWVDLGDEVSQTELDIEIEWWSPSHLAWTFGVGIPMFIFWVLGFPLAWLVILWKNRHRLNDFKFKKYFIIWYQGLKNDWFYWEVVNTIRKFVLVSINIFIFDSDINIKILIGISFIFVMNRIQIRLNPYKINLFNELELREILASLITLFSGLVSQKP
jgi:hypothetical protein